MSKTLIAFFVLCLFASICGVALAENSKPGESTTSAQFSSAILNPTSNVNELKSKCIAAAIRGISLDRQRIMNWIENYDSLRPGQNSLEELRSQLAKLEEDLNKYENINLDSYQLPEKILLEAWTVGRKVKEDDQVYFKSQTRSDLFYHIVGINGNNYSIIESNDSLSNPSNVYLMTIYPVYPRHYPFPDFYIYIDSLKK